MAPAAPPRAPGTLSTGCGALVARGGAPPVALGQSLSDVMYEPLASACGYSRACMCRGAERLVWG
eukprot:4204384-Alexandrium_andersonii.AAC.1